LKRKTANVQAPVAKKKYNYYAEKYTGERKTETYLEEAETKSVQQAPQPRPTSRDAAQVTER
jgi:phage terminase large subunit